MTDDTDRDTMEDLSILLLPLRHQTLLLDLETADHLEVEMEEEHHGKQIKIEQMVWFILVIFQVHQLKLLSQI
jgi:hypothetical protein